MQHVDIHTLAVKRTPKPTATARPFIIDFLSSSWAIAVCHVAAAPEHNKIRVFIRQMQGSKLLFLLGELTVLQGLISHGIHSMFKNSRTKPKKHNDIINKMKPYQVQSKPLACDHQLGFLYCQPTDLASQTTLQACDKHPSFSL